MFDEQQCKINTLLGLDIHEILKIIFITFSAHTFPYFFRCFPQFLNIFHISHISQIFICQKKKYIFISQHKKKNIIHSRKKVLYLISPKKIQCMEQSGNKKIYKEQYFRLVWYSRYRWWCMIEFLFGIWFKVNCQPNPLFVFPRTHTLQVWGISWAEQFKIPREKYQKNYYYFMFILNVIKIWNIPGKFLSDIFSSAGIQCCILFSYFKVAFSGKTDYRWCSEGWRNFIILLWEINVNIIIQCVYLLAIHFYFAWKTAKNMKCHPYRWISSRRLHNSDVKFRNCKNCKNCEVKRP